MPNSRYNPSSYSSDVNNNVPLRHQSKDGTLYNQLPTAEIGYPSPAFPSPGPPSSSFASPTPFKSLEEAKTFSDMRQNDAILKRRIRLLKFLLRLITLLLSLYMIATMAATFHKYFSTRNTILPAPSPSSPDTLVPRGPWSRNTKTWPTTILLTTSTLSFLVSLGVMAAYLHGGVRAANTTSEYGSYVGALTFLMHLGLWIAVAAAYRAGKDGDDLWGWTCDERADRIQNAFEGVIVFRRYCDIQTSSWVVSCAQVGVVALWALVYAWGWRRLAGQREMGRRFGGRGEGEAERGLRYVHRESWITKWVPTRR